MTSVRAAPVFSQHSTKKRDYIRAVSGQRENIRRALASRRQVQLKDAPALLNVGRGPKLPAHNLERRELSNATTLKLAPVFKKLRHALASLCGPNLYPPGTVIFLSRNVNYTFAVRFGFLTGTRSNASQERQAVRAPA